MLNTPFFYFLLLVFPLVCVRVMRLKRLKQNFFFFHCPKGNSIKVWQSLHRNCKEDRIHYFKCKYGPFAYRHRHCSSSSHYANDYDRPLAFKCAHNGVITGVKSTYSAGHRDRRWDIESNEAVGMAMVTESHLWLNNSDNDNNDGNNTKNDINNKMMMM